jgi:hypothetical protein
LQDGRSLVPLLHGQRVAEWRAVALVEHRGPHKDSTDPDAPALRSGNPTTYEAIRGLTSVYVEYANGEKEYHDLAADPDELRNSFSCCPARRRRPCTRRSERSRSAATHQLPGGGAPESRRDTEIKSPCPETPERRREIAPLGPIPISGSR